MSDYDIHLDDKYGSLRLIDVGAEAAAHSPWFNQTLTTVNDSVVRLGVIEGDFHWHELEGADTVRLRPNQGYTVPKGTMHKTSAPARTVILMVESAGVVPTGD
jgi:hypothetical protein